MHDLDIDLETFSSVSISDSGVHKYVLSPDFEILFFAYAVDHGAVQIIDLASGEKAPEWIIAALKDPDYIKHAHNATRTVNPLKKMQSLTVIACKLLRIIFTILKKGIHFDPERMMRDIVYPTQQETAV